MQAYTFVYLSIFIEENQIKKGKKKLHDIGGKIAIIWKIIPNDKVSVTVHEICVCFLLLLTEQVLRKIYVMKFPL